MALYLYDIKRNNDMIYTTSLTHYKALQSKGISATLTTKEALKTRTSK